VNVPPERPGPPPPRPNPLAPRHRLRVEDYRDLRALIGDHCGLAFPDDAAYLFEKRLATRLEARGLDGFQAYCRFLREDPDRAPEMEAVVEALTTHETYFFREPHQLRAFADPILPALAAANARQRRVRIWSAGCSTGEEVYTIAVLLAMSGLFADWDVDVVGSDIVRRVIAVARAGVYGDHAFRTPEAEALRPWVSEEGGKWHVREEVRRMVSFAHHNLLDPRGASVIGFVDVVFCRNVLIYLDLPARRRVLRTFFTKLRPGGFLLLGHSESLAHLTDEFEPVQLRDQLVYRKPRPPA